MTEFSNSFLTAWQLLATSDARLLGIVLLSLSVSVAATLIACVVGMPIGALLAVGRFPAGAC
jgi:tungstate transport system permease protein